MRGRWNQLGIPHRGWACIDVHDLGAPTGTCEMCNREEIRFVHEIRHPDWENALNVGCVCVEKMSGDYVAPRRREAELRKRASRRARWLTRKWRVSEKGSEYLNVDGANITIFCYRCGPKKGLWGYKVDDSFSRRAFISAAAAKLAAFDALYPMDAVIPRSRI
jgi:hypothetical protein